MMESRRSQHALAWTPADGVDWLEAATTGHVSLARLRKPETRNALSTEVLERIVMLLEAFDADPGCRAIVFAGDDRIFAAGADIREMLGASAMAMHGKPRLALWHRLRRLRKPVVAAVNGFALGGGNELAMACDIIVAGESAVFGQPEVSLGLMPGGGGTQRLVRAIGKAQAMDVILTGRTLTAPEALAVGLVSRVVPDEVCLTVAIEVATDIARRGPLAVQFAKEAVLAAMDAPLERGLDQERRLFELLFATHDVQEGLAAFLEKRKPAFEGH
jgi:enoyl-CoA hydratase